MYRSSLGLALRSFVKSIELGSNVIIENRAGAGGQMAAQVLRRPSRSTNT